MSLELGALVSWIIATAVFVAIVSVLYSKVVRRRNTDEREDETSSR